MILYHDISTQTSFVYYVPLFGLRIVCAHEQHCLSLVGSYPNLEVLDRDGTFFSVKIRPLDVLFPRSFDARLGTATYIHDTASTVTVYISDVMAWGRCPIVTHAFRYVTAVRRLSVTTHTNQAWCSVLLCGVCFSNHSSCPVLVRCCVLHLCWCLFTTGFATLPEVCR